MLRKTIQTFLISLSLLAGTVQAVEREATVYVRQENHGRLEQSIEILTDLKNTEEVEGNFFKVVLGMDDKPIRFDDELYGLKAAHAYYHASLARAFYLKNFQTNHVQSLPQVIIRLEHTNFYDDASHFIRDESKADYNNALSVPASDDRRSPKEPAWGPEMWFRPAKTIKLDSAVYLTADVLTDPQVRNLFYESIAINSATQMARDLSSVYWDFGKVDYRTHLITMAVSIGVLEILPRVVKLVSKKIKRKINMDAVMFPEIIYHEYAHIAFSDRLPLFEFNAVVEGYANYFAGLMTNYHKLMYKGGKFSRGLSGKDARKFQQYSYDLEAPMMAQSSFTFKLLMDLKMKLGENTFHKLLVQATTKKNLRDSIRVGLINALFDSVDDVIPEDERTLTKFKIHNVMRELAL